MSGGDDEGTGQRRVPAHPGKSWVEFSTSPIHCCPLRMSRPQEGESDLPPHRDPIRVAEKGAASCRSNKPGRPGPSRGSPERPHWKACARRPLLHRIAQAYC
ncbi:hypothetical protein NDU88_006349 [Pleurodeles waltl]|uniref:Uncharacterized protein n=1 Tax=Pleurodeles waltl TaxID=8319 RepID=A0AAV7RRU1_PLEWA|nr:hypothetical protein NDU88_006349 [Pleurodeles waltl]